MMGARNIFPSHLHVHVRNRRSSTTARLVLIGKLIIERNKRMVLQCQDILGPQSLADLRPLASLRIPQNNLLH